MKSILFLSFSGPFPFNDGKRQRTFAILQALSTRFQIDYLIIDHPSDFEIAVKIKSLKTVRFFSFESKPSIRNKILRKIGCQFVRTPGLGDYITQLSIQNSYDFIFSRYLFPVINIPKSHQIVVDLDDEYFETVTTRIKNENDFYRKLRLWQILLLNRNIYFKLLKKSTIVFTVKSELLPVFSFVLPNLPFQALLIDQLNFFPSVSKKLLFIGKLSYPANAKGLKWFLEEVWPSVHEVLPDLSLSIVSVSLPNDKFILDLIESSSNTELKINVERIGTFYKEASMVIAPIFEGGGSNIKISEALYFGRIILTTDFGIKGYTQYTNQPFILIGNSADFWKERILSEFNDPRNLIENQKLAFSIFRSDFSLEKWSEFLLDIVTNELEKRYI